MRLMLACIGKLKQGPERELCARYIDRSVAVARQAGLTGIELREFSEGKARGVAERMSEEAKHIWPLAAGGARLVVLDERGKSLSSEAFAADIGQARDDGTPAYVLALGGPDGHDQELRSRADLVFAFGAATWPHQLGRIMAAEQIYRAITILTGHPYHRG